MTVLSAQPGGYARDATDVAAIGAPAVSFDEPHTRRSERAWSEVKLHPVVGDVPASQVAGRGGRREAVRVLGERVGVEVPTGWWGPYLAHEDRSDPVLDLPFAGEQTRDHRVEKTQCEPPQQMAVHVHTVGRAWLGP